MSESAFQPLGAILPRVYSTLFPEIAATDAPVEVVATCASCAMCARDETEPKALYFAPDAKCCTYHPSLPNYLVGALLADEPTADDGAEGRRRIRERLARRVGVTPRGIGPARQHEVVYDALGERLFGRARALICPYFDAGSGGCTVWPFREATCSTFHCKFVHGADGLAYWRSLKALLAGVEQSLAELAMHRLGYTPEQILAAPVPDPEPEEFDRGVVPDETQRARFGDWFGREEEYFVACHRAVEALTPEEARAACGVRAGLRLADLAERAAVLRAPSLPDPLLRNPRLHQRRDATGKVVLVGFFELQPVRLRPEVLVALDEFDGRTRTDIVLERVQARYGFTFSHGLLVRLHQLRVLVAAAGRP